MKWLLSEQGRLYLLEKYVAAEESVHTIAAAQGTYPKAISRALAHHGIPARDPAAAQKTALEKGRSKHPTKGRERTDEEKKAIRDGWKAHEPQTETKAK